MPVTPPTTPGAAMAPGVACGVPTVRAARRRRRALGSAPSEAPAPRWGAPAARAPAPCRCFAAEAVVALLPSARAPTLPSVLRRPAPTRSLSTPHRRLPRGHPRRHPIRPAPAANVKAAPSTPQTAGPLANAAQAHIAITAMASHQTDTQPVSCQAPALIPPPLLLRVRNSTSPGPARPPPQTNLLLLPLAASSTPHRLRLPPQRAARERPPLSTRRRRPRPVPLPVLSRAPLIVREGQLLAVSYGPNRSKSSIASKVHVVPPPTHALRRVSELQPAETVLPVDDSRTTRRALDQHMAPSTLRHQRANGGIRLPGVHLPEVHTLICAQRRSLREASARKQPPSLAPLDVGAPLCTRRKDRRLPHLEPILEPPPTFQIEVEVPPTTPPVPPPPPPGPPQAVHRRPAAPPFPTLHRPAAPILPRRRTAPTHVRLQQHHIAHVPAHADAPSPLASDTVVQEGAAALALLPRPRANLTLRLGLPPLKQARVQSQDPIIVFRRARVPVPRMFPPVARTPRQHPSHRIHLLRRTAPLPYDPWQRPAGRTIAAHCAAWPQSRRATPRREWIPCPPYPTARTHTYSSPPSVPQSKSALIAAKITRCFSMPSPRSAAGHTRLTRHTRGREPKHRCSMRR